MLRIGIGAQGEAGSKPPFVQQALGLPSAIQGKILSVLSSKSIKMTVFIQVSPLIFCKTLDALKAPRVSK
eukprot:16447796-Heterocapsa_arctica.AAC.1